MDHLTNSPAGGGASNTGSRGRSHSWRPSAGVKQSVTAAPTYDPARAAATDAGNRSMRKAGRTVWSEDDWNAAAECYAKLRGKAP